MLNVKGRNSHAVAPPILFSLLYHNRLNKSTKKSPSKSGTKNISLFQNLLAPSALVTFRAKQVSGKALVHRHHCFLVGGHDLFSTFRTLVSAHTNL